MRIYEKYLLIFLVFLLPTQLAYHFWPSWSFVFGIRVDLLAPAVYLTDVLIAALVLLNLKIYKPLLKYLFLLIFFALINIQFSASPFESLYKWTKVLEFTLFTIYISNQKIMNNLEIIKALFYSSVFFSAIGVLQFFNKGTINGLLYFLGERSFHSSTPGIALVNIFGQDYLRAYSTFPHPNSLAGFMGIVLILFFTSLKLKKNIYSYTGITVIIICILLAFSLSSFLGLFMVILIHILNLRKLWINNMGIIILNISIFVSIIFPLIAGVVGNSTLHLPNNIKERIDMAYVSGKMAGDNYLMGAGLGSFIQEASKYSGIDSYMWILQPVHNIFLLVLTETGILGLILFCFMLYKFFRLLINRQLTNMLMVFIFILLTGLADHYWFTLQQNQLLLSLLIGLSLRYDKSL